MSNDEKAALLWIALVAIAFVVGYRSTRAIEPRSRLDPKAWHKAAMRAFPWALLPAPSMAFGAVAIPMPAGLLIVGWIWSIIDPAPDVQGPNAASGPIACMALMISWAMFFAFVLFRLRLQGKREKAA